MQLGREEGLTSCGLRGTFLEALQALKRRSAGLVCHIFPQAHDVWGGGWLRSIAVVSAGPTKVNAALRCGSPLQQAGLKGSTNEEGMPAGRKRQACNVSTGDSAIITTGRNRHHNNRSESRNQGYKRDIVGSPDKTSVPLKSMVQHKHWYHESSRGSADAYFDAAMIRSGNLGSRVHNVPVRKQ